MGQALGSEVIPESASSSFKCAKQLPAASISAQEGQAASNNFKRSCEAVGSARELRAVLQDGVARAVDAL
eukprot:568305-Alexandrium_andersonii.AAC.1